MITYTADARQRSTPKLTDNDCAKVTVEKEWGRLGIGRRTGCGKVSEGGNESTSEAAAMHHMAKSGAAHQYSEMFAPKLHKWPHTAAAPREYNVWTTW